ncbi:hypothetical protein VPHD480_0220 [Vibrio phage D480]
MVITLPLQTMSASKAEDYCREMGFVFLGMSGKLARIRCERHDMEREVMPFVIRNKTTCAQCYAELPPESRKRGEYKKQKVDTRAKLYINSVYDGDVLVAYKFGITKKRSQQSRLRDIQEGCKYRLEEFTCYYHDDYATVRAIEGVLKTLTVHALSYEEMNDGYTETIAPHELHTIQTIIECMLDNRPWAHLV